MVKPSPQNPDGLLPGEFKIVGCDVVDVIRCDPTHVSVIPPYLARYLGYMVETAQLFNLPDDSLILYKHGVIS